MPSYRADKAQKWRRPLTWLGLLAALALLGYQISSLKVTPGLLADDYVEYWAAGRLNLTGGNPYAADQLLPLEHMAGRDGEALIMWNPPYTLGLVMPLALFPYPLSRLLWLLLNIVMILLTIRWTWALLGGPLTHRRRAYAAVFLFFPTIFALRVGQIGPLLLLGICGFLYFEHKRRDGWAGAFAALLAIKPHFVYLVGIAILIWAVSHRRWRVLGGAAIAIVTATLCAVAVNPPVIGQYLAAVAQDSPLGWMAPTLGSLLRRLFGAERTWLQFAPLVPGFGWLVLYGVRYRQGWRWADRMPLLLLVSALTAAYGWSFDLVVVAPAVLQVLYQTSAAHSPRTNTLILASYLIINVAAFVQSSQMQDFWLIWLTPALLVWYLYAEHESGQVAHQAAGGRW